MSIPSPRPRRASPVRPRPAPLRRAASRAAAGALLAAAAGLCQAGGMADAHARKAAFVYNIAAFAYWAHDRPAGVLSICLQADGGLEAAIQALAARAGQPVTVEPARPGADCRVLVHGVRAAVPAGADTLVICDACELPNGSSAVALVREGDRIRFDVDTERVRESGVILSSQLLRLARRVL